MIRNDLLAFSIAGFRIIVILANEVGAHAAVVVDVVLTFLGGKFVCNLEVLRYSF